MAYASFSNVSKLELNRLERMDIKCFDLCWTKDEWEDLMETHKVKTCMTNSGIVGFWCGRLVYDSEDTEAPGTVEILKIGVDPGSRRQGISRAIIQDILTWTRSEITKCGEITLLVPECMLQPDSWYTDMAGKRTVLTASYAAWFERVGLKPAKNFRVDHPHNLYGVHFPNAFRYVIPSAPTVYGL